MAYLYLTRDDLRTIAYTIQDYSRSQETIAFTNLLLKLTPEDASKIKIDIARGFLIFALEKNVEGIVGVLNESKIYPDSFEMDQRLLDLCEFYDFLKQDTIPEEIFNLTWNQDTLLDDTYKMIKEIVQEDSEIETLESAVPDLEVLRAYIVNVIQNYKEEEKKRWFVNSDRHKAIKLMQFVHANCQNRELLDLSEEKEENNQDNQIEMETHLGLLLFIAIQIESKQWVLPAEGSLLNKGSWFYKEVLSLLGIKKTTELPFCHRIDLLQQFLQFICSVTLSNETDKIISGQEINDVITEIYSFVKTLRSQEKLVPKLLGHISQFTAHQTEEVTPYAGRWLMVAPVVNTLVSYGMWGPCAPAVHLVLFMYSNKASDKLYRVLISEASNDHLKTMVRLYSKAVKEFSKTVAKGVEGFTRVVLNAGSEGRKELYNFMKPEDKKLFERWVNRLLNGLPPGILPDVEIKRIEYVLGLKRGQTFQLESDEDWIDTVAPASPSLNFKRLTS